MVERFTSPSTARSWLDSRTRHEYTQRMPQIPSGAVTFLFTDIEGSTRLLKELLDEYPEALEEHQRLLRSSFDEAGGQESTRKATRSSSSSTGRETPLPRPWSASGCSPNTNGRKAPTCACAWGFIPAKPWSAASATSASPFIVQLESAPPDTVDRYWCRRRRRTSSKTRRSSSLTSTFVIWGSSSQGSRQAGPPLSAHRTRPGRRISAAPDGGYAVRRT